MEQTQQILLLDGNTLQTFCWRYIIVSPERLVSQIQKIKEKNILWRQYTASRKVSQTVEEEQCVLRLTLGN